MNNGVPVNVVMSVLKRDLKRLIVAERLRRGIPSYLVVSVLESILSDMKSDEIDELMDTVVKEGGSDDNTSKQS